MELLCSTGTFIGMMNGRNHRLLLDYGDKINCDGFELMMNNDWFDRLDTIIADVRASGFKIPVLHTNKLTGDIISSGSDEEFRKCVDMWKTEMDIACQLDSSKAVVHIWGVPDSDKYLDRIFVRTMILNETAEAFGIKMLCENAMCSFGSPIEHLLDFVSKCPNLGIIIDVRHAQFHRELGAVYSSKKLWRDNVRHVHISDYHGGYKDWSARRPIYGPGYGDIDFARFFNFINEIGYDGTFTLESPAMQEKGVNYEKINEYLDFIRKGMAVT